MFFLSCQLLWCPLLFIEENKENEIVLIVYSCGPRPPQTLQWFSKQNKEGNMGDVIHTHQLQETQFLF